MPACSAVACSNHPAQGLRLFRFPRDAERRMIWTVNCKRKDWIPTDNSCICEAHFEESQFEASRADKKKKLKPNAIPTIFATHFPLWTLSNQPPQKRALEDDEEEPEDVQYVAEHSYFDKKFIPEISYLNSEDGEQEISAQNDPLSEPLSVGMKQEPIVVEFGSSNEGESLSPYVEESGESESVFRQRCLELENECLRQRVQFLEKKWNAERRKLKNVKEYLKELFNPEKPTTVQKSRKTVFRGAMISDISTAKFPKLPQPKPKGKKLKPNYD